MGDRGNRELTELLERARGGDESAANALWKSVYAELHHLAQRQLSGERAGHTLQPTALVNEAYLRLLGKTPLAWNNRAHFFGAAARAMRRILVDHARARGRAKRDPDRPAAALYDLAAGKLDLGSDLLSLDAALRRLEKFDPRKAEVVELQFFAGLTVRETARALGVSTGTVSGDWKIAKMWLHRELSKGDSDDG